VLVKKQQPADDDKKASVMLEVWNEASLVRRIVIDNRQQHGKIISDATGFGVPIWSPDETCLLYAAERPPPATSSFWDTKDDSSSISISRRRGGQNVLGQGSAEEWGEKYVEQSPLLDLYILNVDTGKIGSVENVPGTSCDDKSSTLDGVTLGQAVWHPSIEQAATIAYTGWDAGALGHMPRRLGMIFCRNRASKIYTSSVEHLLKGLSSSTMDATEEHTTSEQTKDEDYTCITPDYELSRSPRYVELPNGTSTLVFLANPKGFVSHDGCMGLYRWSETNPEECQEVVPVVQTPWNDDKGDQLHGMGFPGLFLSQLPQECGIGNGYVVTNTLWGSFQRIVRIHVETGAVHLVEIGGMTPSELASHSILCKMPNNNGGLVVSEVASNQPARLWQVDDLSLEPANDQGIVTTKARFVSDFGSMAATAYSAVLPKFDIPVEVKLVSMAPPSIEGATDEPIQALLLLPKQATEKKVPLIVIPHGGPHSCTISSYAPGFAYLASRYAVVFPNYRGSIGFGQSSVESLLARIGHVDVEDVMACTHRVVDEYSDRIDATRIGICGGSHGGFLTAHCTGQYPDYFRAAVMRNPVTNIATMVTATDIADWCYAESLGSYDFTKFRGPTQEQLQTMYEKSPIIHVDKVKTPTLLALGMVDLRVPPSQGKEWYHTLRSAGVDTKLLVYPKDCHALDRVTTEADHWIHIKQWFDKYMGRAD
jgi:acylaminoacyl-peptidase